MIRVLIVDDSRVAQQFLVHILSADPAIEVVGVANNGAEALAAVKATRPDVITMDIHMPYVDGFEATRMIMESVPTPIVVVSASPGLDTTDAAATFRALEAGALSVVLRPPGIGHPEYKTAAQELIKTIKLMSAIKVVGRFGRAAKLSVTDMLTPVIRAAGGIQLIAIGASIGGPAALHKILSLLPPDLPVPILIVQHISPGFVEGFVDWLSAASKFPLHIATQGQVPMAGHGYVAPDNFHMGIEGDLHIALSNRPPENGLRPAVSYLFRSVAQVLGPRAVGVLLTGMGNDGASELKLMKERGALTIAQDEASSVVHGMPGEAIKLGAAAYILPPQSIAATLSQLMKKTNG